jgi:hypothetical protein
LNRAKAKKIANTLLREIDLTPKSHLPHHDFLNGDDTGFGADLGEGGIAFTHASPDSECNQESPVIAVG